MKIKNVAFFLILLCLCLIPKTHAESNNKTINLIWSSNPEGSWEEDWIREVLSKSKYNFNEIIDGNHKIILNNSIIVCGFTESAKCMRYFSQYHRLKYKFGVIHLSDESYDHPTNFYGYPQFIIRNYWHKKFASQKNISYFPLGYKRKFWSNISHKEIPHSANRDYVWSFAGQVNKSTRLSMITSMKKIPHYFIHETVNFGSPDALQVGAYRDLLLKSIFVPCPRGWINLDSFRLSEALECGCIPIVEKTPFDYFAKFFGNYPFLSVESWDEAPALINDLLSDPKRLEELRSRCYHWWNDYKNQLQNQVATILENTFD